MYVTILAMKKYKKAKDLKVGDIVELKKEPHEKDPDAIKIDFNGEQIGYVASNEAKTVLKGTLSAAKLYEETKKEKFKVKVIEKIEDKGYMIVFKGEVIKEKKKVINNEVRFSLIGGLATNRGKKDLIEDLKGGETRIVKLYKDENAIFGEYNGKPAGKILTSEDNYEILEEYLEDFPEVTAIALRVDAGNIICSLEARKAIFQRKTNIKGEIERIIKEKINTQEEIEEKLKYLKKNKVSKLNIELILKSYMKYPKDIASRIPKKPEVLYVDTEELVPISIFYINAGKNLIFEGEKGVGKNVLTETLAWIYNRPLYEFSSNSQHSNASLLGSQTFVDKPKKKKNNKVLAGLLGKFFKKEDEATDDEIKALESLVEEIGGSNKDLTFEMSSILEAFKNGGILVLDEFNTSLAHVMPIFNALLDDRRRMEVTGLGQVIGHQNFCAIATQNKNYQGTFESNEATKDRFEPIIFPQTTSIQGILRERIPEINYDTIIIADKLYTGLKSAVEIGNVNQDALSIRGFISACEVISLGMDTKTAFITSVAHRASDLEERRAIENMIDLLIE